MSAILLSIKHKWAEKIYSGYKTVEWRKSIPDYSRLGDKNDVPCVYFYECGIGVTGFASLLDGCFRDFSTGTIPLDIVLMGCVLESELYIYRGKSHLYGWKIFCPFRIDTVPISEFVCNGKHLTRPPQSWCYVDVL